MGVGLQSFQLCFEDIKDEIGIIDGLEHFPCIIIVRKAREYIAKAVSKRKYAFNRAFLLLLGGFFFDFHQVIVIIVPILQQLHSYESFLIILHYLLLLVDCLSLNDDELSYL